MKILFLLFPLLLLLVQGAAGGNRAECRRRGGYCTFGRCRHPTTPVGKCSRFHVCCKSIWG
ncbi:spheniscin-1-like [Prinia subflava]|uniref:spheniscin-1-like n=1 Tax=Prinia subflava TaxID=208062 RepID=UPI002FE3F777